MKNIRFLLPLLLLSACTPKTTHTWLIGVSHPSEDMWRNAVITEMQREATFHEGMSLVIKTVPDDTRQQIRDIEEMIASGIDLLVVSPNEAEALTEVVTKAYQKGIPVILFDRKIDTDQYTAYIGGDNYSIGYEAGQYIAGILNGKGNVVEMRGWKGSTADEERHNGFTEAISQYPGIQIIAQPHGDFLRETARVEMEKVIRMQKPIDLVFAMNDPMALGVQDASRLFSGRRPFIVGIDALPGEGGGIESINKGIIDASFIYPTGGDKVIELAKDILTGEKYNQENILHTAVVDKTNARVIQLQSDQIVQSQEKTDRINKMLDRSLALYSSQRSVLIGSAIFITVILLLLVLQYSAYRSKIKTNRRLEQQNNEIRQQAETLAQQKEQLLRLQEQLQEATDAKLVFFTNISHEFRTPLSLIIGPVETLLNNEYISHHDRELLELVRRNSQRLLSLISQIIDFRSYEKGKMNVSFEETDMKQFIEEMNISFLDYAIRRRVSFSFNSHKENIKAHIDKEKMEKIYFNLLSNAFKHTPEGKKILIELSSLEKDNQPYIQIKVFNEGKYIPSDKIEHIFERFYKADPTDSGSGIGLAYTRILVEEIHKGILTAQSKEGVGTTFTVIIPAGYPDYSNVSPVETNVPFNFSATDDNIALLPLSENTEESFILEEEGGKHDTLALIIEDNADLRRFMRMILSQEYKVIESSDGVNGIEMAISHIPDIIISDVMMPGIDGFEVCRKLKETTATSHIPLILLTACSLDEQKAQGFEQGADAYIPKPFNAELLKIRMRKLIENRRKIKKLYANSLIEDSAKTSLATIDEEFVAEFREIVKSNISNPDLSMEDIARQMSYSKVQVYRKIKSITGHTPNELIRIIRLKYARRMLANRDRTISEIAYESGFSSPSYFTKCFREFFKMSPTEIQEKK